MAQIAGTTGADTLTGGGMGDVVTGGAGADTFTYNRFQPDTTVADFGSTYFTATLMGQQETPPNPSAAHGSFSGVLNRAHTEFDFSYTIVGLDIGGQTQTTADNVVASHFHAGPPGTAGGIVFGFLGTPDNDLNAVTSVDPVTGVISSSWFVNEGNAGATLTSQLPNLLGSNLYINVHTTPLPAGEIRGQVIPVDTGADHIDVRALGIGDLETLNFALKPLGFSSVITTEYNGVTSNMVLQGVATNLLTASDFVFADATPTNQTGSAGADDLFGAAGNDVISGGGGADRIYSGQGDDNQDGGDGNDTLFGQSGADTISGGAGNDSIQGNQGADVLVGGDGDDVVNGGKGDDQLFGGAGADTLSGDAGNDYLTGGAGADRFVLRAGGGSELVADFHFDEGDRVMLSPGATFTVGSAGGSVILTLSTGEAIGLVGVSASAFTNDYVVFG